MVDSACLIQSFEPPSQPQRDTVIRALGESVSFGRFVTETLEWEKWSSFSENRYLEEAKRYAKPGLVAQKKALLEAHFKKIAADRTPALLELEAVNSSSVTGVGESCLVDENVCESHYSADAAQKSAQAPAVPMLESRYGEAYYNERNDSTVEVSNFDYVNSSDPQQNLAVGKTPDLQPFDKMDTLNDTSKLDHNLMVADPSLKYDPPDAVKANMDDLDLSEVVYNSAMRLDDPQQNIAVQDLVDESVLASTGNYKPILTFSKKLPLVGKPAVPSSSNLRQPVPPTKKEHNYIQSTRALGSAFLNKKRVSTKSLHMSINLDSSHQDSRRKLVPSKPGLSKIFANSATLKNSKEFPDKIVTDTMKQKKQMTASNALPAIRKSSVEFHSRPPTPQLKKGKTLTVMQRESTSIQNTDLRKSTPKSLHMPINLDSRVGEKERLLSLKRNGTKDDATLIRMPTTNTTYSAQARGKPVISDTTTRTNQIIPMFNSSTFGRKMTTPLHARPSPPPYKNKNSSVLRSSALNLPQIDMKKSFPKSLQSAGVVRNHTPVQKRTTSSCNTSTIRASGDSSSQRSLRGSAHAANIHQLDHKGNKVTKTRLENTTNRMKDTEKCPPHKMARPETPTNIIRPPTPTVSTPFRFRSDERAAKRKNEKLKEKYKTESENSLQKKGMFPSTMPQSPICIRKPSPGKARETKNYPAYLQTLAT